MLTRLAVLRTRLEPMLLDQIGLKLLDQARSPYLELLELGQNLNSIPRFGNDFEPFSMIG